MLFFFPNRRAIMRNTHVAALALLLGGCSLEGGCGDRVIEAKPDFDGNLIAYRYVRNCGATTGFSTNIAIGKRGEKADAAQLIFTADSNHGAADMQGDAVWVEMRWTRPHRLSVAYAKAARVFRSDAHVQGAAIFYRPSSRSIAIEEPPPLE
jgi:hypothetical protein